MTNDEEYEIMPHKTIKRIKKDIEALQEKAESAEEVASPEFKKSWPFEVILYIRRPRPFSVSHIPVMSPLSSRECKRG